MQHSTKLLLLTASPRDLPPLDISREVQEITVRAGHAIRLVDRHCVTPEGVRAAIRDERPDIVQITAHGSKWGYIMVEHGVDGRDLFAEELIEVFAAVPSVKLVVLRSCHSFPIAHSIAQTIGLAIGMSASVCDQATIGFVGSLYQHIAEGISVVEAFPRAQRLHEALAAPTNAVPRLAQASPTSDHRFAARSPARTPWTAKVHPCALLAGASARPFVGRRALLDALHAAWSRGQTRVINLVGGAGLGKTTVLMRWLDELRTRRWAGAAAVYVHGLDHLDRASTRLDAHAGWAADALKFFADDLGTVAASSTQVEHTGWALGQQLARILQQRRCLVVLDGVASPLRFPAARRGGWAHDPVLDGLLHELLLAGSACASTLVVASRAPLWHRTAPHLVHIQLDPLSAAQASRLLCQLGVAGDDASLAALADSCAHQPLALALAAHDVVYHHEGDARATCLPERAGARGLSRALAGFAAHLRPELRDRLERIVLAGGFAEATEDGELAYLRGYLLASGAATGRERVVVHPAVRAHLERSAPAAGEVWRARYRADADRTEVAGKSPLRHRESLRPLLDAIAAAARAGLWDQALAHYFDRLVVDVQRPRMTRELGLVMPALFVIQQFLGEDMQPVDPAIGRVEHAILLHQLGLALRHLGCTSAAVAPLGQALERFAELRSCAPRFPTLDPRERAATCANDLAEVHIALGRLPSAIEVARHGEELSQHLITADDMALRIAPILCLATRGHALRLFGRHEEAGDVFAKVDRLTVDGQAKSRPGHYVCLWQLDQLARTGGSCEPLAARLTAAGAWSGAQDIARVTPALVALCEGLLATHRAAAGDGDREVHRERARDHLTAAIHRFGATEHVWQLPAAYLASAALRRECEEWTDAELELRRAGELAAACELELDAIDVCLESARLEQARHALDPQEHRIHRVRELLGRARRGIAVTDYRLRSPDGNTLAAWLAVHLCDDR